jgi:hypothetical protein
MNIRIVTAVSLAACAAVLSVAATSASGANAHRTPTVTAGAHAPGDSSTVGKKGECYINPPGPRKGRDDIAVLSDRFTDPDFEAYNSAGAADFKKCRTVSQIDTAGVYFNGSGPAQSVDVAFYKLKGTLPGKLTKQYSNLSYTDSTGTGSLSVKIPTTKTKKGGWVSVVAEMDFSSGGEWGWDITSNQQHNPDAWENPGGGFGTGCASWNTVWTCLGDLGDWVVTLHK